MNTAVTAPLPAARKLRAVLADDEPLSRAELARLLATEPGVTLEAQYRDGCEAIEGIALLKPDIAVLDIRMPGFTGLEVAEQLARGVEPEAVPSIVFVTAFDHYAVRAFELGAIDYLLKPVDESRFRLTMERVRQRIAAEVRTAAADRLAQLVEALAAIEPPAPPSWLTRLVVQIGGTLRVIPVVTVEWIEADGNYARVHAATGRPLLRATLASLETRLDPSAFVRVHRSAIVRIDRIREMKPQRSGDYQIVLESGARVVMSRRYRDVVLERIGTLGSAG